MGVQVDRFIPPGTRVHIALDPRVYAGDEVEGLVQHSERDPQGKGYRVGVFVAHMPDALREFMRENGSPTAMVVVRDDRVKTSDPRVREALYQAACARLDTRQPEAALSAAERALAADPENRCYQGMVHRARAELALSQGRREEALWEIEKAWAYTPRDPRVQLLREQLRRAKGSRFARGTSEMVVVPERDEEVELDLADVEVLWE